MNFVGLRLGLCVWWVQECVLLVVVCLLIVLLFVISWFVWFGWIVVFLFDCLLVWLFNYCRLRFVVCVYFTVVFVDWFVNLLWVGVVCFGVVLCFCWSFRYVFGCLTGWFALLRLLVLLVFTCFLLLFVFLRLFVRIEEVIVSYVVYIWFLLCLFVWCLASL